MDKLYDPVDVENSHIVLLNQANDSESSGMTFVECFLYAGLCVKCSADISSLQKPLQNLRKLILLLFILYRHLDTQSKLIWSYDGICK